MNAEDFVSGKLKRDTRLLERAIERDGKLISYWEPSSDAGFGTLFLRGEVIQLHKQYAGYLTDIGYTVANQVQEYQEALRKAQKEGKRKELEMVTEIMQEKQSIPADEDNRQITPKKRGRKPKAEEETEKPVELEG